MWSLEADYAFAYTKVSAEWTREQFEAGAQRNASASWFVQGMQTLSPRWFVAARYEGISAPPFGGEITGSPRLAYTNAEASAGYRVSPELTIRSSWFATRWYTSTGYDHQAGVSLVWSRRWW